MVLQNKYKARASRRYNSARGGSSDGRGRGRGGGRGGGVNRRFNESEFPTLPGQSAEEEGEGQEDEGDSDTSEETRIQRSKYAPRKLTSNSWRYEEPSKENEEGEGQEEEEEPEPEIDLSGLLERVAKLDSSRTSKALSSEQAIQDALNADKSDIDSSLLHLLDRQKERQNAEDIAHSLSRHKLTEEQRKELEREGKRLQEEKLRHEKHERRAKVLQKSNQKSISLDIGNNRRVPKEDGKHSRKREIPIKDQSSLSYLSDEEDEENALNNDQIDGDVDAFLTELNEAAPTIKPDSKYISQNSNTQHSHLPPATHKADDEDFLDSIL